MGIPPRYQWILGVMLLVSSLRVARPFATTKLFIPSCHACRLSRRFSVPHNLSPPLADNSIQLPSQVEKWIDIDLPEGRCVGVRIADISAYSNDLVGDKSHWMHQVYHPQELEYGRSLPPATARSFWMGRLAMRIALDFPEYPILKDAFGRPALPPFMSGSISHKQDYGIALVRAAETSDLLDDDDSYSSPPMVGVDLELTARPGKRSIATRVLTPNEQRTLGSLPGISVEEEVLLRFSLKEAIYKAAHPLLCQYVSFQEAEVTPLEDGTATCQWLLESQADASLGNLTAHWQRLSDGFFLTSASAMPSATTAPKPT